MVLAFKSTKQSISDKTSNLSHITELVNKLNFKQIFKIIRRPLSLVKNFARKSSPPISTASDPASSLL